MILLLLFLDYNVKISKETITVGEPIEITIQWKDTFKLYPSSPDTMMIEILDKDIKTEKNESKGIWKLTAYSPGDKTVNFLRKGDTIPAVQINFTVKSVLTGKERDIADVRPPMGMFNPLYLLYLLLIPLALIIYLLVRRKKHKPPVVKEEEVPPDVEALETLNKIKDLIDEDLKLFFTGLSELFRRYIERRFRIPAIEATTTEIAHYIRKKHIKELEVCIDWLREWDIYKFTEIMPQKQRAEEYFKKVEEFINVSK
ncbi:MAG TPA: hypothetical protein ENF18_07360 [candidate division WOR-3 bacterium]|uniref:DUF4381 family protein n=1 Tax=candidate division WOR-3 bacterium TaxID=2052148 RepID=A0A7C0VCI1_UNCW3|nr:hypothetical protein [candidate division WOR-3 bacterium]